MMNGIPSSGEANEVALIADELSRAVELTLNPTISHDARTQAYNACESFKENSPWCAQAGLLLASGNQYSAVVKHFGLQLMENTVKYKWTQIVQAEKIFIKENAMKLLYMGGWEIGHLNDALARVIVEMIKREWPQQWPTLLAELSDACARGHMHTEIVLHVFLRLVEDVATLQTLEQHQRRKDIYQALTSNMAEIFAFFMRLIELHVQQFREKTAAGDLNSAASNGRVVQVVLLTLTGFVEWVSTNHIVTNNGRLLQILCILLEDDAFRLPAAECLLQVVNRKGSTKERKPLMILFNEEAISCFHRAALASINVVEEKNYLFLKKLAQVLSGLGQQLTSLWSNVTNIDSWMPVLLETMLVLSSHPSLTLAHSANSVWLAFFKHEQTSKLPHLLNVVPRWLQLMAPKVLKVTFPSSRVNGVNDAVAYACIDYDSDQEFLMFFSRCRAEILESFRHCMSAAPLVTWSYVEQWTGSALDKVGNCTPDMDIHHPLYIEWEALSQVLDVTLSRLLHAAPRPDVSAGLQLLRRCVLSEPAAPLLQSLLLSFVSALFVFLSCAYSQLAGPSVGNMGAELLPRVLDKIFTALVYEGLDPNGPRTKDVKNVRRHAASLLVKLASKYPLLLLPVFNRLHAAAQSALSRPGLSTVESVTLQEALLLVSNHFCCYEKQSAFVQQVVAEITEQWASLAVHVSTPEALAHLIGLDTDINDNEQQMNARRTLLYALTLLLAVVKRTQVPDDPDKASRGGFNAGTTPNGNPVWRNPCEPHVLPLLPHALSLARSLHALHTRPTLRHVGHSRALCLPHVELRNLLPRQEERESAPHERMQLYVHGLHDHVCQLVGAAAANLPRAMYSPSGPVAATAAGALLAGAGGLPDHWLRSVLRSALRPLLHHCAPPALLPVAAPLVETLAPFMLTHLTQRWEYINSLYESGKLEEEASSDAQEVIEDILVRNLTREYIEVVKIILVGGPLLVESSNDMEDDSSSNNTNHRPAEQVSEFGAMVLSRSSAGPALLQTVVRALAWGDSPASLRACSLVVAATRAAPLAAGEACAVLAGVLRALTLHGQHDANQAALLAAAVQLYELLRPVFPSVAGVLRAIPDVDAADVRRLDDKLAAGPPRALKVDKSRRDLFRKITSRLIGRNVGQLFKKEVLIMNLPHMNVTPKEKPRSAVDAPEGASLERLFANGST